MQRRHDVREARDQAVSAQAEARRHEVLVALEDPEVGPRRLDGEERLERDEVSGGVLDPEDPAVAREVGHRAGASTWWVHCGML